jgi:Family of unknown function (DUF6483)
MLRRDYILRMVEEFIQALSRINSLKKDQRWDEASREVDAEFKKLVGEGAGAIAAVSETELFSRLMQDGPTHALRDKTLVLTSLLKEAGDVATGEGHAERGRVCYLKALSLLLGVLARGEVFECPAFVPKIEMLVAALNSTALPAPTHAMLMQHYERTGEFAKAEDALFTMLDADPDNDAIVEFGVAFYQRILSQSDATLNEAKLPRAEAEEGLKELQLRRK